MPIRLLAATLLLAGCTTLTAPPAPPPDVLLVGEQHDAMRHPALQEALVRDLARSGRLRVLAVEMAERGTTTAGLPAHATDAQVRAALRWGEDSGWPWERYGLPIMAAVRAGVPVVGANLPRAEMRQAMAERDLDQLLPGPALKAQQQAIRQGHCDMLPEAQVTPMTRVQVARDLAMARTLASHVQPGRTVVLIAGAGHVQPDIGIPQHLPPVLRVRSEVLPPEDTGKDYCAELRRQMQRR
jgi:uncharacterized iron-regulated protein